MFKLMRLKQDLYRVYDPDRGIDSQGTEAEAFEKMEALGVPREETSAAIADMNYRDGNCADFGIRLGTFPEKRFGFTFSNRRNVGVIGHFMHWGIVE